MQQSSAQWRPTGTVEVHRWAMFLFHVLWEAFATPVFVLPLCVSTVESEQTTARVGEVKNNV